MPLQRPTGLNGRDPKYFIAFFEKYFIYFFPETKDENNLNQDPVSPTRYKKKQTHEVIAKSTQNGRKKVTPLY